MADIFQNGGKVMIKMIILQLYLTELYDFYDLYIVHYVFDKTKSDSDLTDWIA